jgi:predicted DNA-binding transcriptional regulator YafY
MLAEKNKGGNPMKVDRLVSMVMILLEKERIGAQALAEMFEVSPRTVYRDMDAIARAGIPVRATSGVGGGFEIMRQYKLEKKVFSTGDLSAILTGLTGLSTMIRGDELANALAKIRSFIPAGSAEEIERKASQTQIDLSPWTGGRNVQPDLDIIRTALQEHRLLSFAYTDQHGRKTARTAEPCQLVLKSSQWYWYGFCRLRNDYRLFKLCRTSGLQMLTETFIPRDAQNPQLDFSEQLHLMEMEITLRIHESILDSVLDYCDDECISPDGDAYFTVCFPFVENDYNYHILLGFGEACECLEPPHVRAEMKRRVHAIAALYERDVFGS